MQSFLFPPRRAAIAVALGSALGLAGCMSLAPDHERPPAPVAAVFPDAPAAPADAARAADIPWQRFIEDARTARLVELALANNRDLRIATLNVERTRAQYRIQQADQWPTLGVNASATRQHMGAAPLASQYFVGLGVSAFELDLFGRVRSLSDAALAQYFATDEGRKAAQIALVGAVARAQLALQADDELIALTEQTLRTRNESQRLTQLRFDNGVVSELDLQQSLSLTSSARATLAALQRQRRLDENALVLLLGQPLPSDLPPAQPLSQLRFADLPAGLPSELLDRRPDIRQAEQQLRAANANIGAARAAFFPRITLTASVGSASSQLDGLFESGSGAWSFIPQLVLPIFDAGRNQANLEATKASREIAVAQYEKTIQGAFREVADALAGRATLDTQLRELRAQADAESGRLRLSDLRYQNGVASFLDLLDAQRALFAVQQQALQLQLAQLQNQVTLYQVLGGGWQEPVPPQAAAQP